jgi:hypothetical protein
LVRARRREAPETHQLARDRTCACEVRPSRLLPGGARLARERHVLAVLEELLQLELLLGASLRKLVNIFDLLLPGVLPREAKPLLHGVAKLKARRGGKLRDEFVNDELRPRYWRHDGAEQERC